MIKYCDYHMCQNEATQSYLGGMLNLCSTHRNYYHELVPRMLNLRTNRRRSRIDRFSRIDIVIKKIL